jgi:UPF0716 family protein affecting phage T7 exclusion
MAYIIFLAFIFFGMLLGIFLIRHQKFYYIKRMISRRKKYLKPFLPAK